MLDEFRSTSITWDKATRRIYSPITANESDSNGRKLNIQVVNSGQVENLTGATLHLYWETKDKAQHGLDAFTASNISKGEFEIFYTTGMLSNVGELHAALVLVDSTGKVVSDWFKITVTRGINEGAIESENSFSSLTQALIDISNLEQNYAPRLNDLTAQLQQKADQAFVDSQFSAMVSGTPKGPYTNLSALQIAYPSGAEGIFLVLADGHWYYWNSTTSAWVDGGIYQTTGVGEDVALVAENIMFNGNVVGDANGDGIADGFAKNGANVTAPRIESNRQYWKSLSTAFSGSMVAYMKKNNIPGHRYYVRFYQKNVGQVYFTQTDNLLRNQTSDGMVEVILNSTSASTNSNIIFYPRTANVESYLERIVILDLTEIFGVGNEPTDYEFRTLIRKFTMGYFDKINLSQPRQTFIKSANDVLLENTNVISTNVGDAITELATKKVSEIDLLDASVKFYKTDFINVSVNLFDKNNPDTVKGKFINAYTGVVAESASLYYSHKIPVEPGYQITMRWTAMHGGAGFDASGNYVFGFGTMQSGVQEAPHTFIIPEGVSYILTNGELSKIETDMVVSGTVYPSFYVPHRKTLTNDYGLNQSQMSEVQSLSSSNNLYGKIISGNGDSIMMGAGENAANRRAWLGRIAERNNMILENRSVAGATVATGTLNNENPRHWVSADIENMRIDADYIILQGGYNDSFHTTVGIITNNFDGPFDTTTYCGALEDMFRKAQLRYIGKKIGFIITYKTIGSYPSSNWKVFAENARLVCEKWSIPYLDLFNAGGWSVNIPEVQSALFADTIHMKEAGYDATVDKVESWLRSL